MISPALVPVRHISSDGFAPTISKETPCRSRGGGASKEDLDTPYHGKINKHTSCKDVGIIIQSNILCSHACERFIFLFCSSPYKRLKVKWPLQYIVKKKLWNYYHPWDPIKWAQEGGLISQACFRLKEFRPDLFVGVTHEMEGPNFDSINNGNNDNDDDNKNNSQVRAKANKNWWKIVLNINWIIPP